MSIESFEFFALKLLGLLNSELGFKPVQAMKLVARSPRPYQSRIR